MALTIRLDDSELQALERIKYLVGKNTSSGAIKKLISDYEVLVSDYERTKLNNHHLKTKLEKFQKVTKTYMDASHDLADMVYGDEWNNELIRRADALDSGESKGYTLEEFRKKTRSHINEITDK